MWVGDKECCRYTAAGLWVKTEAATQGSSPAVTSWTAPWRPTKPCREKPHLGGVGRLRYLWLLGGEGRLQRIRVADLRRRRTLLAPRLCGSRRQPDQLSLAGLLRTRPGLTVGHPLGPGNACLQQGLGRANIGVMAADEEVPFSATAQRVVSGSGDARMSGRRVNDAGRSVRTLEDGVDVLVQEVGSQRPVQVVVHVHRQLPLQIFQDTVGCQSDLETVRPK